jgi:hypothetical protein
VQSAAETEGSDLLGVMVLEGCIRPVPGALGKIAADPRVLIADTSALEALEILHQHGFDLPVQTDGLDVRVPSPFLDLDWTPRN